jgi:hypothetical protein
MITSILFFITLFLFILILGSLYLLKFVNGNAKIFFDDLQDYSKNKIKLNGKNIRLLPSKMFSLLRTMRYRRRLLWIKFYQGIKLRREIRAKINLKSIAPIKKPA